jgi:hypothetical protein
VKEEQVGQDAPVTPLTFISAKKYYGSDLIGKTIGGVDFWDDEVLIAFTDGTYTRLVAVPDTEDCAVLESAAPFIDADHCYPNYVEFGVFTQEEWDAGVARQKEAQLKRDRADFERLKKVFESEVTP